MTYYLQIKSLYKNDLRSLRKWSNLKVALDKDDIWITNFELVQIESVEVKSIPFKKVFYSKNNKLFLKDSLLPDRNEPTLLWTPIERAFPINLGDFNHNYFGIEEKIEVKLIRDHTERKATAMRTSLTNLVTYIETAPEVRLKNTNWVMLNEDEVLLFGLPLLPINGKTFWASSSSLLPVGFKFDLEILSKQIENKINVENDNLIIWNEDSTYFKVEKNHTRKLTLSSVRKTIIENNKLRQTPEDVD